MALPIKLLDRISSVFFFLGFIASKLQFLPFILVSGIATIVSLCFNFVGYLIWLIASQLRPEHARHPQHWYGFAQFKDQHKVSALLGVIAVAFFLLGVFFPPAMIPAVWIFALSKIIWCVAEYHKKQHPPFYDKDFSRERQALFFNYSIMITSIALISAVATTVSLIFPPASLATFLITIIAGLILGGVALHFWTEAALKPHTPDRLLGKNCRQSYEKTSITLEKTKGAKPSVDSREEPQAPYQPEGRSLFPKKPYTPTQPPSESFSSTLS